MYSLTNLLFFLYLPLSLSLSPALPFPRNISIRISDRIFFVQSTPLPTSQNTTRTPWKTIWSRTPWPRLIISRFTGPTTARHKGSWTSPRVWLRNGNVYSNDYVIAIVVVPPPPKWCIQVHGLILFCCIFIYFSNKWVND